MAVSWVTYGVLWSSALQRAGAVVNGVAPSGGLDGSDMFHHVISGVAVGLILAIGGAFWRMSQNTVRQDTRHEALEKRVDKLDTDVAAIPAALDKLAENVRTQVREIADDVRQTGEKTQSALRDVAEDIGYLKGSSTKGRRRSGDE